MSKQKIDKEIFEKLPPIEKFMSTPKEKGKERLELIKLFAPEVFKNIYFIDGALYVYQEKTGHFERTIKGLRKEISNILIEKLEVLPDSNTLQALELFFNKSNNRLEFKKENTCISFNGQLINIYSGEKVERKPENIALTHLDVNYEDILNIDPIHWKVHLIDQYGEEQTKAILGFLYSALLYENLEVGAIFESTGRSGKGTLQETLTAIFGVRQCGIFQSYDLMEKFRLKNVLDSNIAFFDETEALSNAKFKTLTGSKNATVELKGKDAETIRYTTTFIFFSNEIIQMKAFKFAESERLCLFRAKGITTTQKDPDFKPRMIEKKLELLKLILTVGKDYFTEKKGKTLYHNNEMLEDYQQENNSLESGISEFYELDKEIKISFNVIDEKLIQNLGKEWKDLSIVKKGRLLTNIFGKEVKEKKNGSIIYHLRLKCLG